MTVEESLALLDELIAEAEKVRAERRLLTGWKSQCDAALVQLFGMMSEHRREFKKIGFKSTTFRLPGEPVPDVFNPGLDSAIALLQSFKWQVEKFGPLKRTTPPAGLDVVESVCNRFAAFCRQLQHRHADRPALSVTDEYDVQDLLHALLTIHFDDVRREEPTPSFAGGWSRMDLTLKAEKIVIECKMAREGLTTKKLGEELAIDITKYKGHPDCRTLICFVYDPQHRLVNPSSLDDLAMSVTDFTVRVIVSPK